MRRPVTAALLLVWLGTACETNENALLLSVTVSDVYVQDMEVEVRSLGEDGLVDVQRNLVERDGIDIAASPIRVAVTLPAPMDVAVRLVSNEVGGRATHSAFRCYRVEGIVEDSFALLPLSASDGDGDGWPGDLAAGCGEGCPSPACPAELADCDDSNSAVNPGVNEVCGLDSNCDGEARECPDEDMDGVNACPPGQVSSEEDPCDCDDLRPDINPDATEECGASEDVDCDGYFGDLCDRDMDGVFANAEVGGFPDCDDTNPNINPNQEESCDTPDDENCDGVVDEGCFPDDYDADGVFVADGDCDNCDPSSFPGGEEICGDGIDQDCDGMDLMCAADDADGDGVRAGSAQECDDTDPMINASAAEQCDTGEDEDCDGAIDEDCPDPDGDGFVEAGTAYEACEGDPGRNPGVAETCDGTDEDCDGIVDEDAAGDREVCIREPGGAVALIDTETSLQHCGGCGISCHPRRADTCVDGACGCSTDSRGELCDPGLVCCDGAGSASGCRDFSNDFDNCGDCGNACDNARADACVDGQCRCGSSLPCAGALTCCRGRCVDLDTNANNCGSCRSACGPGEQCSGGLCVCYDDEMADEQGEDACRSNEVCCDRDERCRATSSC